VHLNSVLWQGGEERKYCSHVQKELDAFENHSCLLPRRVTASTFILVTIYEALLALLFLRSQTFKAVWVRF